MRTFWVIKDTGTVGPRVGAYFAGWVQDVTSSWTHDRSKAFEFESKKGAFRGLYLGMSRAPIYAPHGSRLRFVVVRVKTDDPKRDASKISQTDGIDRLPIRRRSKNSSHPRNSTNEKIRSGSTEPVKDGL